jgi:thioredoxin reductase (NADPH)
VIDAGASRAALIPESHNYPGFAGVGGPELLHRLWAQACEYGAEFASGKVSGLRIDVAGNFIAQLGDHDLRASRVLLATGLVDHRPPIEGPAPEHPAEVIRFCPICDAYEFIDRRIAVPGDLETAGRKALHLQQQRLAVRDERAL